MVRTLWRDSIGRWEGGALLIDTLSDQFRVLERWRMIDDICGENERNPIESNQIRTIVR